jgi:transposase
MGKKKKVFTSSFKFKVVLESFIKGNVSQVARQYNIHPNLISNWRALFNKKGEMLFEEKNIDVESKYKKKITDLENLIGKKEVELNLLKGYLDFYAPLDGN